MKLDTIKIKISKYFNRTYFVFTVIFGDLHEKSNVYYNFERPTFLQSKYEFMGEHVLRK